MTSTYLKTYFALLGLLGLTVGVSYIHWAPALGIAVATGIAVAKGTLVALFFMHLKHARSLTHVMAASGFFWLSILLSLTLTDYFSRGLLPTGQ